MKRLLVLLAALLAFALAPAIAQDDRPYKEGPVTIVTHVKIIEGQYDNYMAYLGRTYKPIMEAQKAAGHILSWGIYDASPRGPGDPDMYLVVTYPNMAAFDGMYERLSPIQRQITGMTRDQAAKASADRGAMREILGSEMIREVILK